MPRTKKTPAPAERDDLADRLTAETKPYGRMDELGITAKDITAADVSQKLSRSPTSPISVKPLNLGGRPYVVTGGTWTDKGHFYDCLPLYLPGAFESKFQGAPVKLVPSVPENGTDRGNYYLGVRVLVGRAEYVIGPGSEQRQLEGGDPAPNGQDPAPNGQDPAPEEKPAKRSRRAKQGFLPDMEPEHIPEIEAAAEALRTVREQRMELTRAELRQAELLLALLKKHGLTRHVYDGHEAFVESKTTEKVRVRSLDSGDGQEDEEGEEFGHE